MLCVELRSRNILRSLEQGFTLPGNDWKCSFPMTQLKTYMILSGPYIAAVKVRKQRPTEEGFLTDLLSFP